MLLLSSAYEIFEVTKRLRRVKQIVAELSRKDLRFQQLASPATAPFRDGELTPAVDHLPHSLPEVDYLRALGHL